MARAKNKRLSNRGVRVYYSLDEPTVIYTELADGSDWKGPAGTGTVGDGMAYEDRGHEYGIPQSRKETVEFTLKPKFTAVPPVFKVFDIVHMVRVDSNAHGLHCLVQLLAVNPGDRAANGAPVWTGSGETLEDPTAILPDDLLDFLGLTGTLLVDPVEGAWSITPP